MAGGLPPPPTRSASGDFIWVDWYNKLNTLLNTGGSIAWSTINFTGSKLSDIQTRDHNTLTSLQGGTAGEYYHLTAAQYANLGSAINSTPVGNITPSTGAFTTLSASSTVSGAGFSTYLASPPAIGATSAGSGKFTTLQSTGTFTPSTTSGIVGTTLANNAQAGSVGEVLTATVTTVSTPSATNTNVVTLSLSPGDWDVQGFASFNPAASTIPNTLITGLSSVSASFGGLGTYVVTRATFATGGDERQTTPIVRFNVSTTTTIYLVVQPGYTVSTLTTDGVIFARRVR